jgi:hypothetical protein
VLNGTNYPSGKPLQYLFGAIELHFDAAQLFQTSTTKPSRDDAVAEEYGRAVQALRDVRHLLPAERVAIVDTALDLLGVT